MTGIMETVLPYKNCITINYTFHVFEVKIKANMKGIYVFVVSDIQSIA